MRLNDDDVGRLLDTLDVELELNRAAPQLEPLLDAVLAQAPPAALERLAADVAAALWSADLEQELSLELGKLRDDAVEPDAELLSTIDAAQVELKRAPARNRIALALVWRAAVTLIRRANRNRERMAELEQTLAQTLPAGHRRLALSVAPTASLAVDVGDEEAARAIARFAFDLPNDRRAGRRKLDRAAARLARTLATDERRRDAREALAELADLCAEDFPLSAAALERLLAEPVPGDPTKDELWVHLVVGLAQEQLLESLADEPSG